MARHVADREDLWTEVTALEPRGEWRIPSAASPVTAGVRSDGRASIYFGGDPAYHFDAAGRLRRAFVEGALFRSAGDRLARLTREQSPEASQLWRCELTPADLTEWLAAMQIRLQGFLQAFDSGAARLLRSSPSTADWDAVLRPLRAAAAAPQLAPALVKRRAT